jgi:hypothetical protein
MYLPLQFLNQLAVLKLDMNIMTLTHTSVPYFWGPTVCNNRVGGTLAPLSLDAEIMCSKSSWKNITILLHYSSMLV